MSMRLYKLPSAAWMQKNGFGSFYITIKKYPLIFKNFVLERLTHYPVSYWVKYAEELAKKNGGLLPLGRKNARPGLERRLREDPEPFRHIQRQIYTRRTENEWHKIAQKLLKDNNGRIPNTGVLGKLGYASLGAHLRKNKNFSQYKWDRLKTKPRKSVQDAISEAQNLTIKHGHFPNTTWLRRNGFGYITRYRHKHPELFASIYKSKPKNNA